MSDTGMKYEDWLRGCVHHDGRKGNVYLPCDVVLAIADWIEAHRYAEPVVRCKDCIHCADDWNGNQPMFTCELGRCAESVQPNDYCSYGEVMTMPDLCTDNRFELINKYRQRLIEATNIETSPDEMKVLYNILFRFWQMGWLDRLEEEKHGRWIREQNCWYRCSVCGGHYPCIADNMKYNYCPNCGSRMDARMDGSEDEESEE